MQDTQLATDIVIGILGEYTTTNPVAGLTWIRIVALQGAFAEHQAMLQNVSGKGHLEVIQVRTPEELKRCDALIIPGGGLSISNDSCAVLTQPAIPRVNYHRTTCTSIRVDRTSSGVRQDKSGVGNLRRCNSPFASCVKSKERRTGTLGRCLGYHYEERLGITSNVIIAAAALLLGGTKIQY
jgi:SNO glutamine amidotransferase family